MRQKWHAVFIKEASMFFGTLIYHVYSLDQDDGCLMLAMILNTENGQIALIS
jgi:hypothetical protein